MDTMPIPLEIRILPSSNVNTPLSNLILTTKFLVPVSLQIRLIAQQQPPHPSSLPLRVLLLLQSLEQLLGKPEMTIILCIPSDCTTTSRNSYGNS